MATNYAGQKAAQRERREVLEDLRDQLGDRMFADFLIELLSEHGAHLQVAAYPALVHCYAVRIASRDRGEGYSEAAGCHSPKRKGGSEAALEAVSAFDPPC